MTPVIYLGEKVIHFQIQQVFRDKNGKFFHFRGIKNVFPGNCYEVKDDTIKVRPQMIESDLQMTFEERREFDAHRIAVKDFRLSRRKAMELKKPNKQISQAILLLRPFLLSLDRMNQRRFIDYILNEATKKKK